MSYFGKCSQKCVWSTFSHVAHSISFLKTMASNEQREKHAHCTCKTNRFSLIYRGESLSINLNRNKAFRKYIFLTLQSETQIIPCNIGIFFGWVLPNENSRTLKMVSSFTDFIRNQFTTPLSLHYHFPLNKNLGIKIHHAHCTQIHRYISLHYKFHNFADTSVVFPHTK